MKNPNTAHNSLNSQSKDKHYGNQIKTIFHFLSENVATASMVSEATGVPQKNFCRYKRDLEKRGLLKEVYKGLCQKTGFKAWYLTTDPNKFPVSIQVDLFRSDSYGGLY